MEVDSSLTYLTHLTRSVFRQSDRPLPKARPEPLLGARDRDRVRPRLTTEHGVQGGVVDLSEFRRRTDRTIPDGHREVENVPAHALVHGVGDSLARPGSADLDRPQPLSPTHGPTVPTNDGPPCQHPTSVAARCYSNRSYDHRLRERVTVDTSNYCPSGMPPSDWDRIAPFVRDAVTQTQAHYAGRYNTKDMLGAVAHHTRWVTLVACLPLERGVVFHRDVIADFVANGCAARSPNSRANTRTFLLRVAEAVLGDEERVTRLKPLNKDAPTRPYSEFEQRSLGSWAEGQTTPSRRFNCRAILALGLGAGLSTPDILSLRTSQIVVDPLGVLVQVDRPSSRRDVPVLAAWEQPLIDLVAVREPDEWAVGTQRTGTNSNWLNDYLRRTQPEQRLRPEVGRLRNTWLVHHLVSGTPLGPLSVAAGLDTFRMFEKLLCFVPEPSLSEVRRSMRRPLRGVG